MPYSKLVTETKQKMTKTVEFLQDELKGLRTGRASTGLVENLKVEYYGSPTPLKQVAALAAPEADMIVIKPFDPSSIGEIEKAIKNSDLSLAPQVDGKVIRLKIPALSEERRRQLVAQAKKLGEDAKVTVRNIRRDAIKVLEKNEKDKVVTEDDLEKGKKHIDDLTKELTDKVDGIVKMRSDDIMRD
jgi:ribosome recycling factor